jgi:dissimilatory sulfite reductase (desulfoviridin) alpha/beta subunit
MSDVKHTKQELSKLKAAGFIKERGKDLFTVRLRVPGGRMSVQRLKKIADVADKFGGEFVHLSVRQSMELVNVNFKNFNAIIEELGETEQKIASGGAQVRVPVACGGCEYNPNGLVDTQKSAIEVDEKLFGTSTGHHKFKVAFAGCPFDCPKSATNDVGLQGAVYPALKDEDCIGCGLCAKNCVPKAIDMREEHIPVRSDDSCIWCGDCVRVCPAGAWRAAKRGYTVRIGGKWGRNPLVGTLFATFLPENRVVEFIAAVLEWYKLKAEGLGRIRLGDIIIKEEPEGLLGHLRTQFPEYTVSKTIAPQIITTQVGNH